MVGPGANADFLGYGVGEMGEALENVISEGENGTAASQMMSSQAEELDELGAWLKAQLARG